MKRNASAILIILFFFLVIVGLNFVFMTGEDESKETEENGNRSSYRSSKFGTLAYYTLLEQSGYPVTRFEKPFTKLKDRTDIGTLVIISLPPLLNPSQEEFKALTEWVQAGHQLIIIDREIYVPFGEMQARTTDFTFQENEQFLKPTQPSLYTLGIAQVKTTGNAPRITVENGAVTYHIGDARGAILADSPVGSSRVVMLTEPYIVANNGIAEADNALLAVNLFANAPPGKIAFDEFHHGYGNSSGSQGFLAYFNGTPVKWMFYQALFLTALLLYTYGRRFARPLPLRKEHRTTNLEFVSSMANITRLARATDLAMQNIYANFRNKLCHYCGLPTRVDSPRLANVAARRLKREERDIRDLLAKCEKAMRGEPTSEAEMLQLTRRIREIEAEIRI
jgi:hypothetical protein